MKNIYRTLFVISASALLFGCATGEIKSYDSHRGAMTYTWTGTEEAIHEKAREACPNGYDVETEMGQLLPKIRSISVICHN